MHSLRDIHAGMKVIDAGRRQIGTVEAVRFGEDDPSTPEVEAAGLGPQGVDGPRRGSLLEAFADVFAPDDLPEEIRARLLHQGFVRIDADGLFAADRYVTPDQIEGVADDTLVLRVSRDALMRRN